MKRMLYLIVLLIPFLLVNFSFAKEMVFIKPPIDLVDNYTFLTANQVKDLIEVQTKTIGQNKVVTLDTVYVDYGKNLITTLLCTNAFLETKKNIMFGTKEQALFIKAVTIYLLAQNNNVGAPLIGLAIMNDRSVITLIVVQDRVYLYDTEENAFRTPKDYIDVGYEFALMII